jgi:integrase
LAYVIERVDKHGRSRYRGMFTSVDGKIKTAGTFDTHERAIEVAREEEAHARSQLDETRPAEKATKTIKQFGDERFLTSHHSGAGTRQNYGYTLKNHVYPYIGHKRISEINRETFYNLLIKVLPSEDGACASPTTVRATRKVLSSLCQMAMDEGYRDTNPLRTIRLPKAPTKPVLVANHDQWKRFEAALAGFRPARLYARVNVTTWARRCEMISFRPRDFDLDTGMVTISRSTVYLSSGYHPAGKAGWLTKDNPKNGDWRRFTISKQLCAGIADHIAEYDLGPDDILFPQWMFAYRRSLIQPSSDQSQSIPGQRIGEAEPAKLPPISTPTGVVHEHGTMGARFGLNCKCYHCRNFAAEYQRNHRRKRVAEKEAEGLLTQANTWRRDGTEFLMADVWGRYWAIARQAADLPEDFTPYNARHTGISWAIAKGIDLQKVRQRAGHGSLEVTSRYAAILDEQDTTVADSFEEIFENFTS